ncbi:MAG TPA: hypothetical protein VNT22_09960 [Baekduia sp.]|nr:hypothetical protein [Baekduia sp.]
MARRSLRPQLNQIRTWVRQGRTDAWIAHKLEVTVQQIEAFKKENDLSDEAAGNGAAARDFDDEIDLRAADDELIAAELEAEAAAAPDEEPADDEDASEDDEDANGRPKRRRGRRGGRGRSRTRREALEGTFDHGDEGYGLWLDPAIADSPVYAEYWAGHRQVEVSISSDQIIIRRAGEEAVSEDDGAEDAA